MLGAALALTSGTLASCTVAAMAGSAAGLATPAMAITPCVEQALDRGGGRLDGGRPPRPPQVDGVPAEQAVVVVEVELEALLDVVADLGVRARSPGATSPIVMVRPDGLAPIRARAGSAAQAASPPVAPTAAAAPNIRRSWRRSSVGPSGHWLAIASRHRFDSSRAPARYGPPGFYPRIRAARQRGSRRAATAQRGQTPPARPPILDQSRRNGRRPAVRRSVHVVPGRARPRPAYRCDNSSGTSRSPVAVAPATTARRSAAAPSGRPPAYRVRAPRRDHRPAAPPPHRRRGRARTPRRRSATGASATHAARRRPSPGQPGRRPQRQLPAGRVTGQDHPAVGRRSRPVTRAGTARHRGRARRRTCPASHRPAPRSGGTPGWPPT